MNDSETIDSGRDGKTIAVIIIDVSGDAEPSQHYVVSGSLKLLENGNFDFIGSDGFGRFPLPEDALGRMFAPSRELRYIIGEADYAIRLSMAVVNEPDANGYRETGFSVDDFQRVDTDTFEVL